MQEDTSDWSDIAAFLALAEAGSADRAARVIGIDATTLVRRVRRLEAALRMPLLRSVGRRLVPVDRLEAALEQARAMQAAATAFSRAVSGQAANASGVIRITAIRALVNGVMLPDVRTLIRAHPGLRPEFVGESRNLDLVRGEADIAVRLALPAGAGLVTRRLGTIAYSIFAPAARPDVETWIVYDDSQSTVPEAQWVLTRIDPARIVVRVNGITALISAIAAGLGRGLVPDFAARAHPGLVRIGDAIPVLSRDAWVVAGHEARSSARERAVLDWLIDLFTRERPRLAGRD
jgi:DNA-binding transcriptional LysR family regulator